MLAETQNICVSVTLFCLLLYRYGNGGQMYVRLKGEPLEEVNCFKCLDGWRKGGLGQQRDDGGGCATMRERPEEVKSRGAYVDDSVSFGHFG